MDRQIIYPGAIPLETDLLNTNKYTMVALSKIAATVMGTNTYLRGLTAAPTSPASMVVTVDRGEIYSVQNVDNTAYSSIAADTVNTILKQGIILSQTSFTLTAPTTAGQSINYLVQVTYSDVDSGATVLPYYNAANPSVAYSGPNGAGTAQNTVRSGVCTVALKQGVAATTGTQTTPSPDTGYTAAWVITVAQGATTVTSANISIAPNAPFIPVTGVVPAIQTSSMTYAADTGSANTYVASYVPKLPTLTDGMRLTFKAKTANTGASTFAPNGNTAYPLYSHANQALQGGEIVANGLIEVEWNSTLTAWVLCGNSGGALPVATATQSNQAVNLGQLGNSSTRNVGTTAGTVAAGDDSRITGAAQKANNLSDLASAPTARTNLGLGNSSTLNVGTVAGTVAAADDARIVGALQKSSNLADLPSATSSRANLGLGSAAVANVGTGGGMVPDMSSFTSGASGSASWQKLPSGMLLQYGYINTMSAGLSSVVYPVPFTTYLRSLTLTPTGNLGATSVNAVIPSLAPATGTTLTVFSASGYNIPASGVPAAANILFYWEAIGV